MNSYAHIITLSLGLALLSPFAFSFGAMIFREKLHEQHIKSAAEQVVLANIEEYRALVENEGIMSNSAVFVGYALPVTVPFIRAFNLGINVHKVAALVGLISLVGVLFAFGYCCICKPVIFNADIHSVDDKTQITSRVK